MRQYISEKQSWHDRLLLDAFPENMTEIICDDPEATLLQIIDNLTPKEKAVMQMYYLEHLNAKSIASKLQITSTAVSALRRNALEKIRQPFNSHLLIEQDYDKDTLNPNELGIGTYNHLWKAGYRTYQDLYDDGPEKVFKARGIGPQNFQKLCTSLDIQDRKDWTDFLENLNGTTTYPAGALNPNELGARTYQKLLQAGYHSYDEVYQAGPDRILRMVSGIGRKRIREIAQFLPIKKNDDWYHFLNSN